MEDKNYYAVPAISNSGMSTINPAQGGTPARYKKYVVDRDGGKEDTPSLANGKLVHLYVEDPDQFLVTDVDKPTEKLAAWVEDVYHAFPWSEDAITPQNIIFTKMILEKRGDRYKGLKDETKIIKKFFEGREYLLFLIRSDGQICMTTAQKEVVSGCVKSIHANDMAERLLFTLPSTLMASAENEMALYWKQKVSLTGASIHLDCKALLDRVVFEPETKKVKLIDLKTTGKAGALFNDSFRFYRYYRQMGWYRHALRVYLAHKYGRDQEELWEIEVYIVAVETFGLYECRVFKVSEEYLSMGGSEAHDLVQRIGHSTYYNSWEVSKEERADGYITLEPYEGE